MLCIVNLEKWPMPRAVSVPTQQKGSCGPPRPGASHLCFADLSGSRWMSGGPARVDLLLDSHSLPSPPLV